MNLAAFKNKHIVIFGTGSSEFSFTRSFRDLDPLFYADNNTDKQFTIHGNKIILPPDILDKMEMRNTKVIVASEFYNEISEQLKGFGLQENENFVSHVDLLFEVSDYFIVSYMKCGRTWLRFMIGQLMEGLYGYSEEDMLVYTDTCLKYSDKVPVITALHDDNPHLKNKNELEHHKLKYKNKKVLFMVRDPRDVAISLFYHMKFRANSYTGELETFVIDNISTIVQYYNIWYENRSVPIDFHMIRYEDLHADPVEAFEKVVSFLELKADKSIIEMAIKQSNFKKMKQYETSNKQKNTQLKPRDKSDERSYKVRKGKAGGFEEELSEELINKISTEYLSKLNPVFGYTE